MPDADDLSGDRSARRGPGCRWRRAIAALIVMLPLIYVFGVIYVFGASYRLEEISRVVTRTHSGCEISVNQAGDWKSELLSFGLRAENLEYPLKVMIFVGECPGVSNGEPYALQLMQRSSATPIATGLDCGDDPQSSDGLCRVEVPPIPTRVDSHAFVIKVVRNKGERPEEIDVRVILTRQWRSIAWDVMMSA